jgi:CotH kinase protein/Lamin Tail Domain/PA14 domain/Putative Ig domain
MPFRCRQVSFRNFVSLKWKGGYVFFDWKSWLGLFAACVLFTPRGVAQPASGLLREVYQGIGGTSVSDLTSAAIFPDSPTSTGYVTDFFEAPTDVLEEYGQRLRGFVVPPVSGDYTFWIASDDGSELWLSTDDSPARKRMISSVNAWTPSRAWEQEPNQRSSAIRLNAGQIYYVEALMKEGGGGDNLAVRWLRPDGLDEAPIPASRLIPWGVSLKAPAVLRGPLNTNAVEGLTARFDVILDPLGPARFQWRRNGSNIPGATNSALEFSPVSLADHNARFSVALTNQYGSAISGEGTLTVLPDTTRPTLVQVENRSDQTLRVVFSESVATAGAQVSGNYRLNGGVTVSAAVADPDGRTVLLTVSPLTFGQSYTLTVNNVTDRAGTPNPIQANSTRSFVALEYTPTDVGFPALPGSVVRVGTGQFDVTGGGASLGAGSDQFQFATEQRTGDFDIQVRVDGVTVSDPFLHAGLMARESMAENSRFAAVFASSVQLGCFFESRTAVGVNSTPVAPRDGFPANYPQTWLRLRRAGNSFTGYAGVDGVTWTSLGTANLASAPATLYFGFAVASQNGSRTTTARFRDLGPVTSTVERGLVRTQEPLGPFVRSTGLVVSELMYHPREDAAGRDLEFIELYNAGSIFEDLSGFQLTGEVEFTFPAGFQLQAGEFVVIAANPAHVQTAYGISGVLGPFADHLPNEGGMIQLRAKQGDTLFTVEYGTAHPWPVAPDGAGHSLTLARPSYGPSDARAWASSGRMGGTPGGAELLGEQPLAGLLINELLAHTDEPQLDFVELFNASPSELDLSGCVLTDDIRTNRYRIPDGTRLGARERLAMDQTQLGFRLKAAGETLYLVNPSGTRVLDVVRFGPQENGVSFGRQPDGASSFRRLNQPTPGAANATWRAEDIVISELMYHPISESDDDEYLELFNRGAGPVNLGGWRFTSGIDYRIPAGVTLAAGGYLVVAKNPANLQATHPGLTAAVTLGGYQGTLSDRGERVALARPDDVLSTNEVGVVTSTRIFIDVAEVTYVDGGAWGMWSDGGGSSLELTDVNADPLRGANWADSDETAKGQWTSVSVTGRLDNGNDGFPPDQLQVTLQGGGEALVDDVEVVREGTTANLVANPGFETGAGASATGWTLQGNHTESFVQNTGAVSGNRCLHVRSQARGDTGFNRIRTPLLAGLAPGNTATMRAKVRWVRGWPEVLFRIRGNWLELPAALSVPRNLGTPGQPNSRRIDNAGPAIFEVTHTPPLPAANQAVIVTARVSDPDGITAVNLVGRVDGNSTVVNVVLRDDGTLGDAVPGDGVYSGTISGRSGGAQVIFRVDATDGASTPVTAKFPSDAPAHQCLVRWGDAIPWGTLGHYHLWNTSAVENAHNATSPLNNLFRDFTFVYGNSRVIYGGGFKDKGSPFKGGAGDWYVALPAGEPVLGTDELALTSTGNNGGDNTNLREQLCFTIARGIGAGYLHRRYIRLYRNGDLFRDVMEDSEEPNGDYAERFFSEGTRPDLYKIEDWFEFQDDGTSFSNVDATLERFTTPPNSTSAPLKPARYRWSWRKRAVGDSANNFTNLLNLVEVVNTSGSAYVPRVFSTVDVDQWMRSFAFQRIVGNWDSYGMGRGKNMYAYKRDGLTWKLFSWDVDFALDGGGNGPTDGLWGAGDPVINRMFDDFAIRRRLWQAYLDAVNGPMLPERVAAAADSRAAALRNNGVPTAPNVGAQNYLATRRQTILNAYQAADVPALEITTNGGNELESAGPTVALVGRAPLALANLTVNGVPYPVTWTGFTAWRLTVPLVQRTNTLVIAGTDRFGNPIPGFSDTIRVINNGLIPQPRDFLVINEIQYDAAQPNASYLELHNTSSTTPFDLSGYRLDGVGYTFPPGAVLSAGGFLVLAKDAAGFSAAYGATVPVFGVFPGSLDNDGERLALVQPDPLGGAQEVVLNEVRYSDRAPWPTNAAGFGPSLQLVDPLQDNRRPGNWMSTATNAPNRVTPGAVNAGRATLEPFPLVWLNEVLPVNTSGPLDNAGQRDPYIELYNSGTNAVDLSGFFLTDSYADLTRWAFPQGTVLAANGFLVVWADGDVAQSAALAPHASFRLAATNGSVALVRPQGTPSGPAVMDHLDYGAISPNRSYGSFPDGDPLARRYFQFVTPGAANNPAVPELRVTLNEFMAANASSVTDPADGDHDDWFELHNAGSAAVDLTGYFLTDNLTNWNQFRIPPGYVLPAGGFLVVWADNETAQNAIPNGDLHVNFRLAAAAEQLGLFDPNGQMVDGFGYGTQVDNISTGRFPDGAAGALLALDQPTPGEPNVIAGGNLPPVLQPVGDRTVAEETLLQFTVQASDADASQVLSFTLGADAPPGVALDVRTGAFNWTPNEAQGPGSYGITLRVSDNGTPSRSASERITVTVGEVNRAPVLEPLSSVSINEGSLLTFTAQATDADRPAQELVFSLVNPPSGASVDPVTGVFEWTPVEAQGPGVVPITLRVSDKGTPSLRDERTFTVTVNELDNPPVIVQLPPVSVVEGGTLVVTNRATDPDNPPVALRYSLPAGAPQGVRLDASTGVLTWNTTEDDGPGSHLIVIRVTQSGAAALSDQFTLGVTVEEDNQAPSLAPIDDRTVEEGATVRFTAAGADSDRPAQVLSYSLGPDAPAGAEVEAVSGVFSWTSDPEAGASTNQVTLVVTDNGPGNRSASQTFRVITRPRFRVVIQEVMTHPAAVGAEYVELANASTSTAWSLDGLRLVGRSFSHDFSAGLTLPPGGAVCVVGNVPSFRSAYGALPTVAGAWVGTLNRDGDVLRLIQPGLGGAADVILDEFRFESADPWPAASRGGGAALQLVDSQQDNTRVGNWSAAASYTGPRDLVTLTNEWRYYQSGPLDAAWKAPGFADGAWPVGQGLLFVESADLPAPKNTALTLGQNTYYFRTSFVLPSVPSGAQLILTNVLDDGAVFYLNGKELFRENIGPTVVVDFNTAAGQVGDAALTGPHIVSASDLVAGTNVLAVEVHQVNSGSSDIVFGCALRLEGGVVAAFTPGEANNVRLTLPEFPPVWVSELLARNSTGITDTTGEWEPWIELVNHGDAPVSLDGWFLSNAASDAGRWAFPAGAVLPPRSYTVLIADGQPGQTTPTEWHTSFRLAPSAGVVLLSRTQPGGVAVVDYLRYSGATLNRSAVPDPNGVAGASQTASPSPGAEGGLNLKPTLDPVADRSVVAGEAVRFRLAASDPNLGQSLTFSLVSGPTSLTVSSDGQVEWTPTVAQAGANEVRVRVVDSGVPTLADEQTFTLQVSVPVPLVLGYRLDGDHLDLLLPTEIGRAYRVEVSDELSSSGWTLLQEVLGTGGTVVIRDPMTSNDRSRFYRATVP